MSVFLGAAFQPGKQITYRMWRTQQGGAAGAAAGGEGNRGPEEGSATTLEIPAPAQAVGPSHFESHQELKPDARSRDRRRHPNADRASRKGLTYVGLFRVAPIARERLEKTPEYFDKIHKIVEDEGGTVERFLAIMGPWEYLGIFEYPDLECAFRVLGRIAKLEMFETETFPAEDVKVFWKALV